MREGIVALLSGSLFGAGLAVSGMMDPKRVRGFLDVLGDWDPTLAFVMGGAVLVMTCAWFIQKRLIQPVFADSFNLPSTRLIDRRLIGGAVLFGVGWGLAGLCPGPAIGAFVVEPFSAFVFVGGMLAGMVIHRAISA
ncbi:DUF6691 family protein [Erythrobacter crassostreae]|uniref:YeeE/YedE family protein n=1 Tax=Erythrobacter crassostreae TaxID=2828328 RepID=A0A9X1F1U2_9SPHN|nr:DUF6691 family protein [Erythrobacter crassostrea]MBV7258471.1 YeeE/YedE family protein [Erythrobacter crassostrea]